MKSAKEIENELQLLPSRPANIKTGDRWGVKPISEQLKDAEVEISFFECISEHNFTVKHERVTL
jgi:hypothetical protein